MSKSRWLVVGIAAVMLLGLGSMIGYGDNPDSVSLTVTPGVTLTVVISSDTWAFGQVNLGENKELQDLWVLNDSNCQVKFQFSATDADTAGETHTLTLDTDGSPANNAYSLQAAKDGTGYSTYAPLYSSWSDIPGATALTAHTTYYFDVKLDMGSSTSGTDAGSAHTGTFYVNAVAE